MSLFLWGCTAPQVTQELITATITADKKNIQTKVTPGSTVQEALKTADITLGTMDRVEPPLYAVLSAGDLVKVIRVREEYFIEQKVIPFDHQELRNEALPEGERRLSQPGINGLEEITFHRVFEDDIEVSNNIVKSVNLKAAIPEVVMIGSRSSFASIDFPGKIAYLAAGNAWVIEKSTSNRRLIVSTGDLDGRIFSLSQDGKFLLFSRFSNIENTINSLWVASLQKEPVKLIDLDENNIVHFADFDPGSTIVGYSTVEWRETSPGWQANNDLYEMGVSASGYVGSPRTILEPNSGGVYGWWGMDFSWSPDGENFLYSRPDGVGIVDARNGAVTSIYSITPYQTGGNWAWVPGAAWSPDGNFIFTVDHLFSEDIVNVDSQKFNLIAIPLFGGDPIHLINNVGMFAYPVPSPLQQKSNFIDLDSGTFLDQASFTLAYLQAIFPDQSESSGYRLSVIDRDGSNQKYLFPEEGAAGLYPQNVVWSPDVMSANAGYAIAFIYNGNIWFVDSISGVAQQITGDGLTTQVDWR
jgi:hypothetical protein